MSAESESSSENSDGRAGDRPDAESNSDPDFGVGFDFNPDHSSWIGYALVVVLVGTLVLGLLRPFYPTVSAVAIGSFLTLFGLLVGFLAFRERGRE